MGYYLETFRLTRLEESVFWFPAHLVGWVRMEPSNSLCSGAPGVIKERGGRNSPGLDIVVVGLIRISEISIIFPHRNLQGRAGTAVLLAWCTYSKGWLSWTVCFWEKNLVPISTDNLLECCFGSHTLVLWVHYVGPYGQASVRSGPKATWTESYPEHPQRLPLVRTLDHTNSTPLSVLAHDKNTSWLYVSS